MLHIITLLNIVTLVAGGTTCGNIKDLYRTNTCCNETSETHVPVDIVPSTCPSSDRDYKLVRIGFYPATLQNTQRIRNYWGGAKLVGYEGGEILGERDSNSTGSATTVRNLGGLLSGVYTDVLFDNQKLEDFGNPLLTELLTNWTHQYGNGNYRMNFCVEAYHNFSHMQLASTALGQLDLVAAHGGLWPSQLGLNEINDPVKMLSYEGQLFPGPANSAIYFGDLGNATQLERFEGLFYPTNPIPPPSTIQPFPLYKLNEFLDIFSNPLAQLPLDGEKIDCLVHHSTSP